MGLYKVDPFKVFAGYMYIQYTNPTRPLSAGFNDIGGYVLAFVNDTPYSEEKIVQVYWTGVRLQRSLPPRPDRGILRLPSKCVWHREAGQAARLSRIAPAAEASTLSPSTPTTGLPSTSMLTWAPCTAACMTERRAATSPRTTSTPHWRGGYKF